MPKIPIRQSLLNRRRALDAELCLTYSLQVQQRLLERPEFSAAQCLALYSPVANEVFTEAVCDAAHAQGKLVAYPRVLADGMGFFAVDQRRELARGSFGVLEPPPARAVPLTAINLAVLPGVAFDLRGHRLGYGKGYYDRTFAEAAARPLLVGFAFELQLVERLPSEGHDVRLDLLFTEARVIDFRS